MDENSFYDYNDENESLESYDYFEEIEKEQQLNLSLFSDPFIEVDELKFQNQLLFDKISSISAPSEIYQDLPSNINFSSSKQRFSTQKPKKQNLHSKSEKQKSDIRKKSTNQRENVFYKMQRKNPRESTTFSFINNQPNHAFSSSNFNTKSDHLSFKERYNRSLNPRRSKQPEKNLIKRAAEMQEKLEKIKKENVKLNKNYRAMLYKVEKTKNDVRILQDALNTSHFERLVLGHYEWSNYAEKSF